MNKAWQLRGFIMTVSWWALPCFTSTSIIIYNITPEPFTISINTNINTNYEDHVPEAQNIKPLQTKHFLLPEGINQASYFYDLILAGKDQNIIFKQAINEIDTSVSKAHRKKKQPLLQYAISTSSQGAEAWHSDTNSHKTTVVHGKATYTITATKYNDKNQSTIEYYIQEKPAGYKAKNPETLTVLSWNVDMKPSTLVRNRQHQRARQLIDFLDDYDVIVLSELFDQRALEIFRDRLAAAYPHSTVSHPSGTYGAVLFSKWPIDKIETYPFNELCAGFDCRLPKGVVYARIIKEKKPYNIFGITLQDWPSNKAALVRNEQLKKIKEFIDQQAIPTYEPIVISGAFNINKYKSSFDNKKRNEYEEMLTILNAQAGDHMGHRFTVDPSYNRMANIIDPKEYNDYVFCSINNKKPKKFSNRVCIFKKKLPWKEHYNNANQTDLSSHFALCSLLEF
jgi:endonuclease/exonuclease/phosphatase family metal-dependent hydrolase